jgi:hypothetical protein
VHRLVVDVARNGLIESANSEGARRDAIGLLLIAHEVLDGCNDMLLHGDDGLVKQGPGEKRVITEAFPVATSANDSSETSSYRPKSHVGTFALELCSEVFLRFVDEFFVPCRTKMEAGRVAVDAICVADAVAVVYQAKAWETESRDAARYTRASSRRGLSV